MHPALELLIGICTLAALMYGMLKFMLRDIHKDLGNIQRDIQRDLSNIQSDVTEIKKELKRHDERIDHLYEICIGMVNHTPRR
jgi:peptidoglycan hydrolase CwlO-like protein